MINNRKFIIVLISLILGSIFALLCLFNPVLIGISIAFYTFLGTIISVYCVANVGEHFSKKGSKNDQSNPKVIIG